MFQRTVTRGPQRIYGLACCRAYVTCELQFSRYLVASGAGLLVWLLCWTSMAHLRFFVVLALMLFVSVTTAQNGECEESELGYACMKSLADFYNLHWTLNKDNVEIAMEGIGAEWVGISFAEEENSMAPADAVIGWTEGSRFSVEPYRITIQAVAEDNQDEDVTLSGKSVTQDNDKTIVAFVRSLTDGTVEIDPEEETLINYAIGDMDGLVYHGPNRGSSTVQLSLGAASADENDEKATGPEAAGPSLEPAPEPAPDLDELM